MGAQGFGEPGGGAERIDLHGFPGQRRQRIGHPGARRHAHRRAPLRGQPGRQAGRIEEQVAAFVGMQQGKAEREGGEGHVGAADIEQPVHRGGVADHRGGHAGGAQPGGEGGTLLRLVAPGMFDRLGHHQ